MLLALIASCGSSASPSAAGPRITLDLSGAGWHLWLDRAAGFADDDLFAPPVDLSRLPVNLPTGGWSKLTTVKTDRWDVSVPATVEQYAWDMLATERRVEGTKTPDDPLSGDYVGVSWWWREFDVPDEVLRAGPDGPRHVELQFDAVRLRAEVFVNDELVGRDDVGNTPFACDATAALRAGRNVLAVRVTDPCGNFDWNDHEAQHWGAHTVPASHGFGGVTGGVRLVSSHANRITDAWIENSSRPRSVTAHVSIHEAHESEGLYLEFSVVEKSSGRKVWPAPGDYPDVLPVILGGTRFDVPIDVPSAQTWSPATPQLYEFVAELSRAPGHLSVDVKGQLPRIATKFRPAEAVPVDVERVPFGFRSFTVDDPDGHAVFRLNGERIVLRSAISWGFWPTSGSVPTPELARRQVEDAKSLGLNMLNHHRTLAAPGLLDVQDQLGLLAYEEPGGYACVGGDDLCRALAREKLLRMVRRDRSHPSLAIVNLINEAAATEPPTDAQEQDLLDAHALAPQLAMTFTSAWAKDGDDPFKLHVRPGETEPRTVGWHDEHSAAGPGVWRDSFWNGPSDYRRRTDDASEITFWGEEGAIASPPRLEAIGKDLDQRGTSPAGWDTATYRDWCKQYEQFLDHKGLRQWFPTLDAVTQPLANVACDYQARMIENVRLGDLTDGYVINGWEDEPVENHSGIVDLWRNLKGDPTRLAAANAPTDLVVKLRSTVLAAGDWVSPSVQVPLQTQADVYLVDETARAGPFVLELALRDGKGTALWSREEQVSVHGGDVFGEPLATDLQVSAECQEGPHVLEAELHEPGAAGHPGALVAKGSDTLWVVDWKDQALPVNGAVLESGHALRSFFKKTGRPDLPVYFDGLPPVDYILVGDYEPEVRDVIPADSFGTLDDVWEIDFVKGQEFHPHLGVEYYRGADFKELVAEDGGKPGSIDFDWSREPPIPSLDRTNYSVRWTAELKAPETGRYSIHTLSDDGVRLWLRDVGKDSKPLIDDWSDHEPTWDRAEIYLHAGEVYPLRVEYHQGDGGARIQLCWTRPSQQAKTKSLVADLLRRARTNGTTLCFLDRADRWADALAAAGAVQYAGRMDEGKYWLGGGTLVREHPLFNGLPVNGALGREWQEFSQYGANRFGLRLDGEQCLAFCVSDHQHEPATAVGIVPCGKGKILLSTLDVVRSLNAGLAPPDAGRPYLPGPADATRRYFVNVVQWAGAR